MKIDVDVLKEATINKSDFGDVIRLDINQLGAKVPFADKENQAEWAHLQNEAICHVMDSTASEHEGNFASFAEWTVNSGYLYDGKDIRDLRKKYFGPLYRAAITTCPWLNNDSGLSTRIQSVAYIPKTDKVDFEQKLWQPECHYECEQMGLAPVVISRFGGAKQVFISGVVAWDKDDIQPQFSDNPRKQIRYVLKRIEDIFKEAGGGRHSVTRLRPFVHSAEITEMLKEEIEAFWKDIPAPSLIIADEMSFGNPPVLFTEIQASGVVDDESNKVVHTQIPVPSSLQNNKEFNIHSAKCRDFEIIQAGEISVQAAKSPAEEGKDIIMKIESILNVLSVVPDEVCLVFVYSDSLISVDKFKIAAAKIFKKEQIHIVPCYKMSDTKTGHLKVELTIRRLLK